VHLAVAALKGNDPVVALKQGLTVQGRTFSFDSNNVASGVRQHVYAVDGSNLLKIE
jgi:hypothetical protein